MPRFALPLAICLVATVHDRAPAQAPSAPSTPNDVSVRWQVDDSRKRDTLPDPSASTVRPHPPEKLAFDSATRLNAETADEAVSNSQTVTNAGSDRSLPPTGKHDTPDSGQTEQIPNQLADFDSPLPSADANSPINLPPRREPSTPDFVPRKKGAPRQSAFRGISGSLVTVLGSLAFVLGIFFFVCWAMRRGMPKGARMLPTEAVEVLGRSPLPGKQQMHLVRCGPKLLLVSVSSTGADTLTEITDPDEVARMVALCYRSHPNSATTAFRDVMNQFGRERTPHDRLARRIRSTVDHSGAEDSGLLERANA